MTKKPIGIALIPAYEPSRLLLTLLQEICAAGMTALVVNDGSSPQSRFVFQEAEEYATVLTHEQNLGKGRAIKTGLSYLKERFWGQEYVVVTVDADGQHRVEDAIRVCQAAARSPDTLILGSRKFEGEVPARSRFGNTATRLAYRLATGVPVTDTQTGLRAFHKNLLPQMLSIPGERYEYEMNVLLVLAKEGVPIQEVSIATVYLDHNASSHFNTLKDSCRVYGEILKFTASSILGFLLDFLLYNLLLVFTGGLGSAVSVPVSNVLARFCSAGANYAVNRRLVFHSSCRVGRSLLQYALLAGGILCANTFLLSLLTGLSGMDPIWAKVVTELVFFLLSWAMQKCFIFRRHAAREEPGRP